MKKPISDDRIEECYRRYHTETISQKALAVELDLSHALVNVVVNALGRFQELPAKFPGLIRPEPKKRGRPVTKKAVAEVLPVVAEVADEEPELDLAERLLGQLPDLSPSHAVLLSRVAFPEMHDLYEMINRPMCGRLLKLMGLASHRGRPKGSQKDSDAVKLTEDERLQEEKQRSEEFLEEVTK